MATGRDNVNPDANSVTRSEDPDGLAECGMPAGSGPSPVDFELSARQQEILFAACVGMPDKVIAEKLGISPRTLEGHWRAIHHKLGSSNRCQAGFIFAALRERTQGKILA